MISIDPGKHACGVAWWQGNKLVRAAYVGMSEFTEDIKRPFLTTDVWVERQYLTKKHKRPMDIVDLSFAAGKAAAWATCGVSMCDIHEILPIRWKGNVPKEIMIPRILAKLSPEEVARIERVGNKDHNTIDAIGIGLYGLGRMQTGGL